MTALTERKRPRATLLRAWAARLAAAVLAAGYGAGCSSPSGGAEGLSCSVDSDCFNGLECLPYMMSAEGGCASLGNQCLQPCQTDSDCTTGPSTGLIGLFCQTTCGAKPACEQAPLSSGTADAASAD
jgi:hypothetical protein